MTRPIAAVALLLLLAACGAEPTPTPRPVCPTAGPTSTSAQASLQGAEVATLTVGGAVEGEIVIDIDGDSAPLAAANFVELARCGFYDGLTFHRVVAGFVIQAGDPQTRDNQGLFQGVGGGGPGYQFEIEPPPDNVPFDAFTVAMANAAPVVPDSNGSQFFITLADLDEELRSSGTYSIFGDVVEGTEVIEAIARVPVSDPQYHVPLTPVVIESIVVGEADADEEG
jgi:cyclophilin family peptidyl-prolyl cis-trans isomerase